MLQKPEAEVGMKTTADVLVAVVGVELVVADLVDGARGLADRVGQVLVPRVCLVEPETELKQVEVDVDGRHLPLLRALVRRRRGRGLVAELLTDHLALSGRFRRDELLLELGEELGIASFKMVSFR